MAEPGKLLCLLQDKLGLSEEERQRAARLFDECWQLLRQGTEAETILQSPNDEETQAAAVAWIVRWLLGDRGGGRLPLSDILACAGTNLVAFFREVPVALARLRPYLASAAGARADSVEQGLRLRECQETLVSLTILAKKYKDLFWRVQKAAAVPQPQALQAGWLTFLLLKAQLLQQYPDLVSCLQLLVCVLGCFAASMPYGDAEARALAEQNPAAIDSAGRVNTLKLLAAAARADYAQVAGLMPTVEARFRELLSAGAFPWLAPALDGGAPPHPLAARLATVCSLHAPGMLSERRQLSDLVLFLDSSYQSEFERAGEIDEREFLTTDFGALASPRAMLGAPPQPAAAVPSPAPAHANGAPGAKPPLAPPGALRRPLSLGLQSPLPIMHLGPPAPATPITQAMGSVAWLRGVTKDAAPEPSAALRKLLAAAAPDAAEVLAARAAEAADAVFGPDASGVAAAAAAASAGPDGAAAAEGAAGKLAAAAPAAGAAAAAAPGWALAPSLHASVARDRREDGLRLYWHALDAMLAAEQARAGAAGAAALASRASFHSCLLALSFEMVAASYRMGALSFPAIPERLGLGAFDLTKLIPAFVRALPTMPRELKRHLFTMEEKVVESLGWQASSSLYAVLSAAAGAQEAAGAKEGGSAEGGGGADGGARKAASSGEGADTADGGAAPMDTSAADADVAPTQESQPQARGSQAGQQEQQQQRGADADVPGARPANAGAPMDADSGDASGGDASGGAGGSRPGGSSSWSPSAGGIDGGSGGGSGDEPSSKRRRGEDGLSVAPDRASAGGAPPPGAGGAPGAAGGGAPLPRALGAPPDAGPARGGGGDAAARAVVYDFCRKVLKLAAFRLVAISEGLDFAPMERDEVLAAVHDVVSHALYQETHLFYGRHLDQLLLAALYGYCKVNRLGSITFKEIISHYRRQPHARQEVFRTVALRRAEPSLVTLESGDIIAFYNRVFVPSMKAHLLRRCMGGAAPGGGAAAAAAAGLGGRGSGGAGAGAGAGAAGGGGGASGVSAASAVARHLQPGHINRSPIFAALQHAASQQQAAAAASSALPAGGVIVKRAVGVRSPVQPAPAGGSAYRTLSLDSGASLGTLGGLHSFGSGGPFPGVDGSGSGGGGGGGGGAPGLAALAAVAADGPGPVARGSPLGGKPNSGGSGGGGGHHVSRAYVPSRLGRAGSLGGGGGGAPGGGGGGGFPGSNGLAGGPKPYGSGGPGQHPWGASALGSPVGGLSHGAAPSPTRRGGARMTSPRGPLLVGAPAPAPAAAADVAQCQDQSAHAGGANGGAVGVASPIARAASSGPGGGSPYGARASPSSVRRVGAKRAPHGAAALAALSGGAAGGGGGTPSGLATLLQALESTTTMELDAAAAASGAAGGAQEGGAAEAPAS